MSVNGYDGQRIESFLPSNCCICFRTRPQAPGSDVRTPTGCSAPGPWHPVLSHTALGLGRRVWQKILAVRGNFRRAKTPAPISPPSIAKIAVHLPQRQWRKTRAPKPTMESSMLLPSQPHQRSDPRRKQSFSMRAIPSPTVRRGVWS